MVKVKHILITFGYFLTGINTQDNLKCRQIDFNNSESILEFEPCGSEFIMKTFLDEPIDSCGIDSVNYLSNDQWGWSCFSSIQSFTLDENTEFFSAITLESIDIGNYDEILYNDWINCQKSSLLPNIDDGSFVEIQVYDDAEGIATPVITAVKSRTNNECNKFYGRLENPAENAKVHRIQLLYWATINDVGEGIKVRRQFLNLHWHHYGKLRILYLVI